MLASSIGLSQSARPQQALNSRPAATIPRTAGPRPGAFVPPAKITTGPSTPSVSTSGPSAADLGSLFESIRQSSRPITVNASTPHIENTATPDPNTEWLLGKFKERLSADPTQRAVDRTTGHLRTSQAGQEKLIKDRFARMGGSGSGAEAQALADLGMSTQAATGAAATDAYLGRESNIDQLVAGGAGIAGAPAAGVRADKALGIQQYQAEEAAKQAEINAQIAAQQAESNRQHMLWGTYRDLWALS